MLFGNECRLEAAHLVNVFKEEAVLCPGNCGPFQLLQHKVVQNAVGRKGLFIMGEHSRYVVIAMANHVNDLVIDLNGLLQKKIKEVSHHTLCVMATMETHHSAVAEHTTKVMQFVLKQNECGRPQNGVARSNLLIGESGLRLFLG